MNDRKRLKEKKRRKKYLKGKNLGGQFAGDGILPRSKKYKDYGKSRLLSNKVVIK